MTPSDAPIAEIPPILGTLPAAVHLGARGQTSTDRSLSAYVHIPFCAKRCGYCDFNTYLPTESDELALVTYADTVRSEIVQSRTLMSEAGLPDRALDTIFFGGGTPTFLETSHLTKILQALRDEFDVGQDVEITVEANPDTVDEAKLSELKSAGFTRVSFGVQSAVPHVLETLDRTHQPDRVPDVVDQAKALNFDVSVDLIYGTPGESLRDWEESLDFAVSLGVDHVSAYALTIEPGTAMARKISKGLVAQVNEDKQAEMYELAEEKFENSGLHWYEVSNWARREEQQSRHNMNYWKNNDWWGYGPGAHGHLGSLRQWNVKLPRDYAQRLARGESPAAGREILSDEEHKLEQLMLSARLASGFDVSLIPDDLVSEARLRELIVLNEATQTAVLTLAGRLRADEVVRLLTAEE